MTRCHAQWYREVPLPETKAAMSARFHERGIAMYGTNHFNRSAFRRLGTRVAGVALALSVVATFAPVPAGAATGPSLDGENFSGGTVTAGPASCANDGSGTFSYDATGNAAGPYAGTYTEHGTVTIGDDFGTLSGWEADFTIRSTSPTATITGHKSFKPGTSTSENGGACGSGSFGEAMNLVYTATIVPAAGPAFNDRGFSSADVETFVTLHEGYQSQGTSAGGPLTKRDCKKGGFKNFGFKNEKQCRKAVPKHR